MFSNHRPVWVEVNIDNLIFNMKNIREKIKAKDIYAVVKADAYGHGATEISPILLEYGATRLAVAILSEAVELRKSGITCPIKVLGLIPDTLIDEIIEYDVEPTICSYEYAEKLSKAAVLKNKKVKCHIKVDSGMGRIGFLTSEESVQEVLRISKLTKLVLISISSHFSTADELDKSYSSLQLKRYDWFYNQLKEKGLEICRDIANSAAIMDLPETYFDAVRPGIVLYGYYPSDEVDKESLKIKPVMSLKANIVYIKTLEAHEYIGYGRGFKIEKKTKIATLPVGYADGYTRLLSSKAKVIINGQYAPVIGNICMDQCMIDVTDIEGVEIGDEVILIGQQRGLKFDANDVAKILGTINYEVLTMLGKRIPRVFVKNGEVIKVKNYI